MPKCPVCKTECGDAVVCPECGFEELHPTFLSTEEGNAWVKNVVWPWRERYWKTLPYFEIEHSGLYWTLVKYNPEKDSIDSSTLHIPYGIEVIGKRAFPLIKKDVDIPSSVLVIEDEAFYRTRGFHIGFWLEIPCSVIRIGKDAFKGMLYATITVPKNVKFIGSNAFRGSELFCEAETAPEGWAEDALACVEQVYWGGTWHYEVFPTPNEQKA